MLCYALALWGWSYCLGAYTAVVTAIANEELHVAGLDTVTRLGPSAGPGYGIAVYHRAAADMQDSLFDFRLESLRSHAPMLLALVVAMPFGFRRKLKAAAAGLALLLVFDSFASLLVMTWSYTFLPDHHAFTPFRDSGFRDAVVDFLYRAYNAVGVGFVPVIIWVAVAVRKRDGRMFSEVAQSA